MTTKQEIRDLQDIQELRGGQSASPLGRRRNRHCVSSGARRRQPSTFNTAVGAVELQRKLYDTLEDN